MGMCFGILDALEKARGIRDARNVTIFGELVHHEDVNAELERLGFRSEPEFTRNLPETQGVLITAHGISDIRRAELEKAGKTLVDATCPLVRRAHDSARELARDGYHVLVLGKKGHVEVRCLVEDLTSFDIVESEDDVEALEAKRLGIVCQTTTRSEVADRLLRKVRERNPDAEIRFVDSICNPTREHQEAVEQLLEDVEILVVVGSRHSNNSRQLIDRARVRGVTAYLVPFATDIDDEWFDGKKLVGLTAGKFTLIEAVDEVQRALESR